MSENLEIAMWGIGSIGVLIGVVIMIALEIRSSRVLYCRACKCKLDRPGGIYVPYAGAGFCVRCSSDLLKKVRR